MNKFYTILFVFNVLFSASAQLSDWKFRKAFEVENNAGTAQADLDLVFTVNTQNLLIDGRIEPDGKDVRFAKDCEGTEVLPHYLEGEIGQADTRFWVKLDALQAGSPQRVFMFYGNPAANDVSDSTVFFSSKIVFDRDTSISSLLALEADWIEIVKGVTLTLVSADQVNSDNVLQVSCKNFVLDGDIVGDGAGYLGGVGTDGFGPGGGKESQNTIEAFNLGGGGGAGHGGFGGFSGYCCDNKGYQGLPGLSYGDSAGVNINSGSGGASAAASTSHNPGGSGGGAIRIEALSVVVNGNISMNGMHSESTETTFTSGGGGGSGGGILILSQSTHIQGGLSCAGGNGGLGTTAGGGGAGGRIKVFASSSISGNGTVTVDGGLGATGTRDVYSNGESGENGTIFFNSDSLSLPEVRFLGDLVDDLSLSLLSPLPLCPGSDIAFEASLGLSNYIILLNQDTVFEQVVNDFIISGAQDGDIVTVYGTSFGCAVNESQFIIDLSSVPQSDFSFSSTEFEAEFENLSSDANAFEWQFGDGNESPDLSPLHTYADTGFYEVCLISFDTVNNCSSDTICKTIEINCTRPKAGFSFVGDLLDYQFTSNAEGAQNTLWRVNDELVGYTADFDYAFSDSGHFEVCQIVTNHCSSDTLCENIYVDRCPDPLALFEFEVENSVAQFFDKSSGILELKRWVFPEFSDTLFGDTITYSFPGGPRSYQVCLEVISDCGESSLFCSEVEVLCENPLAGFAFVADDFDYQFRDTSARANELSYFLNDSLISSQANFDYVFSEAGNYWLCQVVKNECYSDTLCLNVEVTCPLPLPAFSFTVDAYQVQFENTSEGGDFYRWIMGNGDTLSASNPNYIYEKPGDYLVCLQAFNNCGNVADSCATVRIVSPESILEYEVLDLKLFPVPVVENLQIQFQESFHHPLVWQLSNQLGQVLKQGDLQKGKTQYQLNLSDLPAGVYQLVITGESKRYQGHISVRP